MVFAVILLTVSSLAAHVNAIPTKGLPDNPVVQHACEGKTLCDIRPDNYPQEEIDRFVLQNLHHLHRMKRRADFVTDPSNNCIKKTQSKTFYSIESNEGVPEIILQSKFFDQTYTAVECETQNETCFEKIVNDENGKRYTCVPVENDIHLLVRTRDGKIEQRRSTISTDCMCDA